MENKRLFFGFKVVSPWPEEWPSGKLLFETDRHLTIAFLGDANAGERMEWFQDFPKMPFQIGLAGVFDRPIFLPYHRPSAAAWHIHWLEGEACFLQFQQTIVSWLQSKGLKVRGKDEKFLAHVTIARCPFVINEWKEMFQKRPFYIRDLCLFESLGSLQYKTCWNYPIIAPFAEKEHMADIAFTVRGTSLQEIHLHAQLALSFHFPPLVRYFSLQEIRSLDETVTSLNAIISKMDKEIGSPFKAVSYHGQLEGEEILEWEMIVDV